ncbi:hypothetical protein CSC94_23245 [Zhengella mangrovi]|uniref:HTH araC/xylS-type domain-containing protein n=1 Tax=Zhengella mangrovi TaxID=1982044 RepID=A0A2G1QGK3_9HYPH|nr:hypothetical protein CSC94_23245 [Zhengella mangrovi]
MLLQTDATVSDIAIWCGFKSFRQFSRACRSAFGVSPATRRPRPAWSRGGGGFRRPHALARRPVDLGRPATAAFLAVRRVAVPLTRRLLQSRGWLPVSRCPRREACSAGLSYCCHTGLERGRRLPTAAASGRPPFCRGRHRRTLPRCR